MPVAKTHFLRKKDFFGSIIKDLRA
jgi:hypothetical protein